ncbi:MAG: KH domain-containing protein [Verrucomicrobiota bacterium]
MPRRIAKIANSLKQLGDIQVTEWDFMGLMHTDIKDLEITRSLRRLGGIQVMEWDFRSALVAVKNTANHEVDLVNLVKRTAHYKVMEWDFRSVFPAEPKPTPPPPAAPLAKCPSPAELQEISARLERFLQFIVANLIDEPNQARITVAQIGPNALRFKLGLVNKDVAMLIGKAGFTAAAIRNILKSVARLNGTQVLLQIHSHEDAMKITHNKIVR